MKEEFNNLFDYLKWWGEISLEQINLNEVDALALTQFAYMYLNEDLKEKSVYTIAEHCAALDSKRYEGDTFALERFQFVSVMAKTRRFGSLPVHDYVNEIDTDNILQFAALSVKVGKDNHFVAYRGTSDEIVGWREDLNLSFLSPIPAQKRAAEYINTVYAKTNAKLYVGGHSKGGNLAMYAAIECERKVQKRILKVYNFDGPGFGKSTDYVKKLSDIKDKLYSFIPKNGVVGILLGSEIDHFVVDSNSSGIFQHNALSWSVMGGKLILADRNDASIQFEKDVNHCLDKLDKKTSETAITLFFDALQSSGAEYLSDIPKNINVLKILSDLSKALNQEQKKLIEELIRAIILYSFNSVGESIKESKFTQFFINLFGFEYKNDGGE